MCGPIADANVLALDISGKEDLNTLTFSDSEGEQENSVATGELDTEADESADESQTEEDEDESDDESLCESEKAVDDDYDPCDPRNIISADHDEVDRLQTSIFDRQASALERASTCTSDTEVARHYKSMAMEIRFQSTSFSSKGCSEAMESPCLSVSELRRRGMFNSSFSTMASTEERTGDAPLVFKPLCAVAPPSGKKRVPAQSRIGRRRSGSTASDDGCSIATGTTTAPASVATTWTSTAQTRAWTVQRRRPPAIVVPRAPAAGAGTLAQKGGAGGAGGGALRTRAGGECFDGMLKAVRMLCSTSSASGGARDACATTPTAAIVAAATAAAKGNTSPKAAAEKALGVALATGLRSFANPQSGADGAETETSTSAGEGAEEAALAEEGLRALSMLPHRRRHMSETPLTVEVDIEVVEVSPEEPQTPCSPWKILFGDAQGGLCASEGPFE